MDVFIYEAYDKLEEIKKLFTDYAKWINMDLSYQNYEEEFKNLPGKYAKPEGRLYIAYLNGKAVGCIALRKIDDLKCEMKRLYVDPAGRGHQIGRKLAEKVINEAKTIGYRQMLLDTLPFMESAIHLYESLGFKKIEAYYSTPLAETIFLTINL